MNIKNKSKMYGAAYMALLFFHSQVTGAEQLLLQESFETDGDGSRYTVIAGGDDGAAIFIARRQVGSNGTFASGGTLDGQWFFGFQDLDGVPGPRGASFDGEELTNRDGRIKIQNINVQGMGNLRLEMAAASGRGGNEPNDDLYMRVRFDGGDWYEIGGFKSESSNSRPIHYVGPHDTMMMGGDPNKLFRFFSDWSWPIVGHGTTMELQITASGNAGDEDHYIDNIRIYGEPDVSFVDAVFANKEVSEPGTGGISNPLTITLNTPAPEGGVTFTLTPSDTRSQGSLNLSANTVLIPAGETSVVVSAEIIQDGQFSGRKTVDLYVNASGYNPALARVLVENSTPKPKVVITEVLNVVPGLLATDVFGDANGDGIYHNTQDQFIEIVNFDTIPVDISGWRIGDDLTDRHLIPEGTILHPNQALLVFGGGIPRGTFGGAIVQIATAGGNGLGFNITSRAETPYLNATFGAQVDLVSVPFNRADYLTVTEALPDGHAGKNVSASVHRLTKEQTEPGVILSTDHIHSIIDGAGQRLFTPGTWIDGSPYFNPENEIILTLSNSEILESDGANAAVGTITLSTAAPAGGFEVELETDGVVVNSNGTFSADEIDLDSLVVVVPEGQTTTTFRIGAHSDGVLDGDQIVSIFARSGPYVITGFAQLVVKDVEVSDLNVVINEIMSDVEETATDLNLDGIQDDALGDQFVELVNNSGRAVDMSGWHLTWDTGGTFAVARPISTFPEGTWVPDGGAIVVFGRISAEAAANAVFGGAIVQNAYDSTGAIKKDGVDLQISTNFDIKLYNRHGFLVHQILEISNAAANQGMSLTRSPDITGDLALHFEVSPAFMTSSPGKRLDGTAFPGSGSVLLTSIFTQAVTYIEAIWLFDPTFGYIAPVAPNAVHLPWVYVENLGTHWYTHKVSDGFWAFDMELDGWFWTSYQIYPWIWRVTPGSAGSWVDRFN